MNENNNVIKKEITFKQIIKKIIALALSTLILVLFVAIPISKIDLIPRKIIYLTIFVSIIVTILVLFFKYRKYPDSIIKIYYHFADFLLMLNIAFLFAKVFFGVFFFPATVKGSSMCPTLNEADHLVVRSLTTPHHFDIIVLQVDSEYNVLYGGISDKELIVKRLIGMPGDSFYYQDGYLYLNGECITESYLVDDEGKFMSFDNMYNTYTNDFNLSDYCKIRGENVCTPGGECRIPDGYYFVMGDNRKRIDGCKFSIDSRDFGLFHQTQIIGVVKYRMESLIKWEKL
ncbi:MAG: signal peptidase I [Bacilli bacterium]|nr:signal peptidase I [Bacilli bacterium]MDD4076724.1 signal peptidase I [Bacilli bacterium]MDD4388576.1 signal peptidase I [Bacilli bacterium]